MEIIFTDHAKQRMIERGIKFNEIKETIELPNYTISKNGKIEAYKKIENKTLRVIYSKEDKYIRIITVIDKQ